MGIFIVFMVFWCNGALFFPLLSNAVAEDSGFFKEKKDENKIIGSKTIFLDDFNHKELFSLDGNFSDRQIIEHGGKTYLVYFDRVEENQIYMCVKAVLSIPAE